MLMESIIAVAVVSLLVIIHVTDSAEEVAAVFTDAAIRIWQFGVDVVASRVRFYGTLALEAIGNALALGLSIAAGLAHGFVVWVWEGIVYVARTYGPVAKDKAVEYGSRALRWTADTLRMLSEELWKLMILSKDRTQEAIERALK